MRSVDLDGIDAQPSGAAGGVGEGLPDAGKSRLVQFDRGMVVRSEGNGAGCHGLPAILRIGGDLRSAVPRLGAARLAAGMGQLDDHRHVRPTAHTFEHALHRRFGTVIVQADVTVGDAPFRADRGRLDRQRARARERQLPEMHLVPVGHLAVLGRILAHRSDDDAVGEPQPANLNRFEQSRHHHSPVLGMEAQGSAGALCSPCCSSSIEIPSGERTNAMYPSRGGRLIVTPPACSRAHVS